MGSTGLLLFGRSGLANRGNLHIWSWHSLVYILSERGNYCIKSFLYFSVFILAVVTAVDNLSHLMPFNRYQTFDPGSRPWYPYSIRFPRMIWYMTCQATYFSQFHAFFSLSNIDIWSTNLASDAVILTWSSLSTWNGWHKMPLCHPFWTYAV